MHKIIFSILISLVFVPSFADNSTLLTTNEIADLKNKLDLQLQDITSLQKQVIELNQTLIELRDNGIKFGVDEDKLGMAIANNQKFNQGWTEGDLLVGSTTIFAFFTFGSFLTTKFESGTKSEQIKFMRFILYSTYAVQIAHLYIIAIIILGYFNPWSYIGTIGITAISLGLILEAVLRIIKAENREKRMELEFSSDPLAKADDVFDNLREKKKQQREEGE